MSITRKVVDGVDVHTTGVNVSKAWVDEIPSVMNKQRGLTLSDIAWTVCDVKA